MAGSDGRSFAGDTFLDAPDRNGTGETPHRVPALSFDEPSGNGRHPGRPLVHALAESEFDAVAVLDAVGRFRFVSASAERIFGYPVRDVIGTDTFALFDDVSLEPVKALFRDLAARRRLTVSLELETIRADGTPIAFEMVAVNHLDDAMGGIVVHLRDVSERRRLHDVDELQSVVIDSLADGVVLVDADGAVVRVNEAFEVMFEAPRVRVLGRRLLDVLVHSGARDAECSTRRVPASRRARTRSGPASGRVAGWSGWCSASRDRPARPCGFG